MQIKPIHTENAYREALRAIEARMDAAANTPDGDLLDILATLVEAYERRTYPVDTPDPVSAIRFYMEQNGMTPKDLQPMIGHMNRVYEVLNHTRPLTLPMIRKLHAALGIPAECLIKEALPA